MFSATLRSDTGVRALPASSGMRAPPACYHRASASTAARSIRRSRVVSLKSMIWSTSNKMAPGSRQVRVCYVAVGLALQAADVEPQRAILCTDVSCLHGRASDPRVDAHHQYTAIRSLLRAVSSTNVAQRGPHVRCTFGDVCLQAVSCHAAAVERDAAMTVPSGISDAARASLFQEECAEQVLLLPRRTDPFDAWTHFLHRIAFFHRAVHSADRFEKLWGCCQIAAPSACM
jgi:hypothetical protein